MAIDKDGGEVPEPFRKRGRFEQDRPDIAQRGHPIDPVTGQALVLPYRKKENARRNNPGGAGGQARDVDFDLF
jgi:hypothetical protein